MNKIIVFSMLIASLAFSDVMITADSRFILIRQDMNEEWPVDHMRGSVIATEDGTLFSFVKDGNGFHRFTLIRSGRGLVSSDLGTAGQHDSVTISTNANTWVIEIEHVLTNSEAQYDVEILGTNVVVSRGRDETWPVKPDSGRLLVTGKGSVVDLRDNRVVSKGSDTPVQVRVDGKDKTRVDKGSDLIMIGNEFIFLSDRGL